MAGSQVIAHHIYIKSKSKRPSPSVYSSELEKYFIQFRRWENLVFCLGSAKLYYKFEVPLDNN